MFPRGPDVTDVTFVRSYLKVTESSFVSAPLLSLWTSEMSSVYSYHDFLSLAQNTEYFLLI